MDNYTKVEGLDALDFAILNQLQSDSSINNSELARRINLSQPATHTRVKRLRATNIIQKNVALLNRKKLGLDMICFIQIQLDAHDESALDTFQAVMLQIAEVLECHHLTGQFDYLLKVVLKDREHLGQFVRSKLVSIKEVRHISTSVVLFEVKSTTALPLPDS